MKYKINYEFLNMFLCCICTMIISFILYCGGISKENLYILSIFINVVLLYLYYLSNIMYSLRELVNIKRGRER